MFKVECLYCLYTSAVCTAWHQSHFCKSPCVLSRVSKLFLIKRRRYWKSNWWEKQWRESVSDGRLSRPATHRLRMSFDGRPLSADFKTARYPGMLTMPLAGPAPWCHEAPLANNVLLKWRAEGLRSATGDLERRTWPHGFRTPAV